MRVTVLVRTKQGMLDPQGEAIAQSLGGLGLPVDGVRAGKVFDLDLATEDPGEARRLATAAAEQALANELIETFEVVLP